MDKGTTLLLLKRLKLSLKKESDTSNLLPPSLSARFKDLMNLLKPILPEHIVFISSVENTKYVGTALKSINEIEFLLDLSESSIKNVEEGKIFDSAEDKIKQAGLSWKNQDKPGVFNNLNTALELMLKEKLQIPTTLTDINTANIIEILTSEKIGPVDHLKEVRKRLFLDSDTKHRGYIPQDHECVRALKSMEELKKVLEPMDLSISETTRDKIYNSARK